MYGRNVLVSNFLENVLKVFFTYAPKIFPSDAQSFVSNNGAKNPEKLGLKSRSIVRFLRIIARTNSAKKGSLLYFFFLI